jgi:hypothetical protein
MDAGFVEQLRLRAYSICSQWETLLRLEPVHSPLANPDALRYLIPETFREVLETLTKIAAQPPLDDTPLSLPACDCGHNPYRAYYKAAEQALVEAAVLIQVRAERKPRHPGEIASVLHALRSLALRDIEAFCGICSHRGDNDRCRHRRLELLTQTRTALR